MRASVGFRVRVRVGFRVRISVGFRDRVNLVYYIDRNNSKQKQKKTVNFLGFSSPK